MARPQKYRRICCEPEYKDFLPDGILSDDLIRLTLDEYEVIRLIDFEKMTHEQCSVQMQISRTTVTEIYEKARYKIADSLINGKRLIISGGNYIICDGTANCHKKCLKIFDTSKKIIPKGESTMRIAVTYENENIFQHFGHSEFFKLYDVENNTVVKTEVVSTMGNGHGAIAGFLTENKVNVLICGGIGGGAQNALAQAGIQLYGGVSGNADEAVNSFLKGNLQFNPDVKCSHHGHDHSCGEHACGENKHGCSGN